MERIKIMKILWADSETTGLDPHTNDIVSLSLLMDIDGVIVDKLDLKIQPINWDAIEDTALAINGFTRDQLKTFMKPEEALGKILAFFDKYVDKFKKNKTMEDKLVPAGYNILFDIQFITEFAKKLGYKYLGAYIDYHKLDVASIVLFLKMNKVFNIPSWKLVDVAKELGIEFAAHNSMADIETTRIVAMQLLDKIKILS
jgi:DNA polymerase III subunit epsilon